MTDAIVEQALEEATRPWILRFVADRLVLPEALQGDGPLALVHLLEAYRLAPMEIPDLLPREHHATTSFVLDRESKLRDLAARGDNGQADAANIPTGFFLPPVHIPSAIEQLGGGGYFSEPAAWLRYLIRRDMAAGRPLPALDTLPFETVLRFETDIIEAYAESLRAQGQLEAAVQMLLREPVILDGGRFFYHAVDACLRSRESRLGLPLAEFGIRFFRRRGEKTKSLEFSQKAGILAEDLQSPAAPTTGAEDSGALAYLYHVAAEGTPVMMAESLTRAFAFAPAGEGPDGPNLGPLMAIVARRDRAVLVAVMETLLGYSGGGDPVQQRVITALEPLLTAGDTPSITLPAIAVTSAPLFGRLVRQRIRALPGGDPLQVAANRIAVFASGFTDMHGCGAHLAHLLQQGDREEIAAIGAYLTRRYGGPFLRGGDILAVISSTAIGDTLLYMTGLAAFAQASQQPVRVLYRASRVALTEFFQHVPELSFEPIPDGAPVPAVLGLNRLGQGNVSVFYEIAWYYEHEAATRLTERQLGKNFLWRKILDVVLSGADYLPERVVPAFPAPRPAEHWNRSARERFVALGLIPGRTVFLSPLANTLFLLTGSRFNHFTGFWQAAIRLFRRHGFTIAANMVNNSANEPTFRDAGVPEVSLDLREIPAFLELCGYFVGVRSGLCDLIALAGVGSLKAKTVYQRGNEHCIGLSEFGIAEVVLDDKPIDPDTLVEGLFADWGLNIP